MDLEQTVEISCPYCGQTLMLLIDCSAGAQRYVEDCQVCCRPMHVAVAIDRRGMPTVDARHEDD